MLTCLVCFIIVKIYFIFSYGFTRMNSGASSGQKRAPEVRELKLHAVVAA